MNNGRWVSVEEAAEYFGVSPRTMWDFIKVNAVESDHPLGINRTRVNLDSLDEFNRSPERRAEAKEKRRLLRAKRRMEGKKKREKGNG